MSSHGIDSDLKNHDKDIGQLSIRLLMLSACLLAPLIFLVYLYLQELTDDVDSASDQLTVINLMRYITAYDHASINKYYLNKRYKLPQGIKAPNAAGLAEKKLYIDNFMALKYSDLLPLWQGGSEVSDRVKSTTGLWSTVGQFNDFYVAVKYRQSFYAELLNRSKIYLKMGGYLKQDINIVSNVLPSAIQQIYRMSEDMGYLSSHVEPAKINNKAEEVIKNILFLTELVDTVDVAKRQEQEQEEIIINEISTWLKRIDSLIKQKKILAFADMLSNSDETFIEMDSSFQLVQSQSIQIINKLYLYQLQRLDWLSDELLSEKLRIQNWRVFVFFMVAILIVLASFTGFYLVANVRLSQMYFREKNEELEFAIEHRVREIKDAQSKAELLNDKLLEEKERAEGLAEKADVANKSKSLFLASMSHEIRTPLNSIIGGSNILKKSELNIKQREILGMVSQSGKMLLELVNDVLDFSKIEADEVELESVEFNLEEIILDLISIFLIKIGEKNITMELDFNSMCEGEWIGDPTRIKQVVMNLMSNAIKFTQQGGVVCKVNCMPGNTVSIAIEDTGVGISVAGQKKLFDAFVQSDNSITRRYGGTGLGLSISKRLVELMNGNIDVVSKLGDGSCFTVEVPLERGLTEAIMPNYKTVMMLVGHDILEKRLAQWGYTVVFARSIEPDDINNVTAIIDVAIGHNTNVESFTERFSDFPDYIPKILLYDFHSGLQSQNLTNSYYPIRYDVQASTFREELKNSCELSKWQSWQTMNMPSSQNTSELLNPVDVSFSGRVLLVEDVEFNQIIATEVMSSIGLNIVCVNNGLEAVELLQEQVFDIVFMDLHMPVMDGYRATKRIRLEEQEKNKQRTPIVAMTADVMADTKSHVLHVGMDEYLSKPFDESELIRIIGLFIQPIVRANTSAIIDSEESASSASNDHQAIVDVFDFAGLKKRLKNRMDRVEVMTNSFLSSLDDYVAAIENAFSSKDSELFVLHSHSLKGTAANIGALELSALAAKLEKLGKTNELANSTELMQQLRPTAQRFKQTLQRTMSA